MSTTEARELGRQRIAERRDRIRRMRRRIVGGAVGVFLALWGVIFAQLATGHDPTLGASASNAATTSTSSGSTVTSSSSSTPTDTGSSSSGSSSSGSTSSAPSAVTSQQS